MKKKMYELNMGEKTNKDDKLDQTELQDLLDFDEVRRSEQEAAVGTQLVVRESSLDGEY